MENTRELHTHGFVEEIKGKTRVSEGRYGGIGFGDTRDIQRAISYDDGQGKTMIARNGQRN